MLLRFLVTMSYFQTSYLLNRVAPLKTSASSNFSNVQTSAFHQKQSMIASYQRQLPRIAIAGGPTIYQTKQPMTVFLGIHGTICVLQ